MLIQVGALPYTKEFQSRVDGFNRIVLNEEKTLRGNYRKKH